MQTSINEKGTLITPTMRKYQTIFETGKITESELISLNSFYNKSNDNKDFINDLMYGNGDAVELDLTPEQNQKGINFLQSLRFTPTDKERKNSPYGYREENILDNFSHFTFCGFYSERGNYYIRMYNCYSNDGDCFQYYYNGKMNIIG